MLNRNLYYTTDVYCTVRDKDGDIQCTKTIDLEALT